MSPTPENIGPDWLANPDFKDVQSKEDWLENEMGELAGWLRGKVSAVKQKLLLRGRKIRREIELKGIIVDLTEEGQCIHPIIIFNETMLVLAGQGFSNVFEVHESEHDSGVRVNWRKPFQNPVKKYGFHQAIGTSRDGGSLMMRDNKIEDEPLTGGSCRTEGVVFVSKDPFPESTPIFPTKFCLRRIIGGIDNNLDSQVKIVQVLRSGLELASGEKI